MFWENDLGTLLEKLDLGFKRPERLDVKKPGPRFDDLSYRAIGKHWGFPFLFLTYLF